MKEPHHGRRALVSTESSPRTRASNDPVAKHLRRSEGVAQVQQPCRDYHGDWFPFRKRRIKKLLWRLIQTRARTVLLLSVKDQFSDDFVAPSGGKWGKVGHFSHICTPLGTPHTRRGPSLIGEDLPRRVSSPAAPQIFRAKILLACCHTAGNTAPGGSTFSRFHSAKRRHTNKLNNKLLGHVPRGHSAATTSEESSATRRVD